jgi:hypothetical protein
MDIAEARQLAQAAHRGQRNRFGEPVVEHLARVAARVPPEARVTAWLHDLLELSDRTPHELRDRGLTSEEVGAIKLVTRAPWETYAGYMRRIAAAGGDAGRLARMIKLADLDDHLAHPDIPADAPPYDWARRQIARAAD